MDLWGPLATGGTAVIVVLVIYITLSVAAMAFGLWLTYTIIWRGVRRGMREYYDGQLAKSISGPPPSFRPSGPRDW